jgi:hypothetical protein
MTTTNTVKYVGAAVSAILGIVIVISTGKLDLPDCTNSRVLSSVVTLWKKKELWSNGKVQDGRLKEPFELPIKISNGRACSAELLINGQASGTISYTVMRPMDGAAGMVTLD